MLKTMFNRLEELILLILDRTHKEGKADLSRFQMLKIIYLIQVYSLKYAGTSLLPQTTFIREKNGPISVDIYKSTDGLVGRGYIKKEIKENKGYGHERHCFSLAKKLPQLNFNKGELLFLDSFLSELLPLTQAQLKARAYATEPMKDILNRERNGVKKTGEVIDFSSVAVDQDVIETYSDL
ncbi:MAG: type II toxin-antitoxin system antitoxin SocA domain-containing protein [Patescibacteria group bacterium]